MNESITLQELIIQWLKDHVLLKHHFYYNPSYLKHISICGYWCVSIFSNSIAIWSKDQVWGVGGWIEPCDPELFSKLEQELLKHVNIDCGNCNELSL